MLFMHELLHCVFKKICFDLYFIACYSSLVLVGWHLLVINISVHCCFQRSALITVEQWSCLSVPFDIQLTARIAFLAVFGADGLAQW